MADSDQYTVRDDVLFRDGHPVEITTTPQNLHALADLLNRRNKEHEDLARMMKANRSHKELYT